MTSTTPGGRSGSSIVALAPVVLLASFIYHPHIHDLTDKAAVAAALTHDTARWGFAHLAAGVGSGFVVLAFLAVHSYLREAGEDRWSALCVPFIVALWPLAHEMRERPRAAHPVGHPRQTLAN